VGEGKRQKTRQKQEQEKLC